MADAKFMDHAGTVLHSKQWSVVLDLVQLTVSECTHKNSKFQTPPPAESGNAVLVRNRDER